MSEIRSKQEIVEKKKELLKGFQRELETYLIKNGKAPVVVNNGLNMEIFIKKNAMFGLSKSNKDIFKLNVFEDNTKYNFTPTSDEYMKLEKEFKDKGDGLSEFINNRMRHYGFRN